jgi:predicted HTH domain antitoxin
MRGKMDFSPVQAFLILLLGSRNGEPVRGKTWLQKEMFLIAKNTGLKEEVYFEPHFYGPYSETIDTELENLQILELVAENGEIRLTGKGKEVYANLLKIASTEKLELIKEVKEELNDLNEDELLAYIYFSFPETTKEAVRFENIERKRAQLAISLYEKEKVSLGKASEIAGMDIKAFMDEIRRKGLKVPLSR